MPNLIAHLSVVAVHGIDAVVTTSRHLLSYYCSTSTPGSLPGRAEVRNVLITQAAGTPSHPSALGLAWLPYAVAFLFLIVLRQVRTHRSGARDSESIRVWLLVRAGALAAIAVMVVLLSDAASEGDGLTLADQPIWSWLVHHRTGFLTSMLIGITQVGSTVAMGLLAAVVVAFLAVRPGRRGQAMLVAVVAVGAGVLVAVLKASIGRTRPPVNFRLVIETNPSFPSGHALASAAIIGVLAVVFLPRIVGRRLRMVLTVAAVLLVGLIGFSRAYLGVHWPTDVLGGWLIASAWLILCLTVRSLCIHGGGSRRVPTV